MSKLIRWDQVRIGDVIEWQDSCPGVYWRVDALKGEGCVVVGRREGISGFKDGATGYFSASSDPNRLCTLIKSHLKEEEFLYTPSERKICLKEK